MENTTNSFTGKQIEEINSINWVLCNYCVYVKTHLSFAIMYKINVTE